MTLNVVIKRVYDPPLPTDGKRVLVDRLWPRGITKERAKLDEWLKDIAPSPNLRTWFGHKPERFKEFADQYKEELNTDPVKLEAVSLVLGWEKEDRVTLIYAAKDPLINHAAILRDHLMEKR